MCRTTKLKLINESVFSADVRASALPYDIDGAGYNSDELGLYVPMVDGTAVKRGMCRAGFTYNAILRNCMPSLGVLNLFFLLYFLQL